MRNPPNTCIYQTETEKSRRGKHEMFLQASLPPVYLLLLFSKSLSLCLSSPLTLTPSFLPYFYFHLILVGFPTPLSQSGQQPICGGRGRQYFYPPCVRARCPLTLSKNFTHNPTIEKTFFLSSILSLAWGLLLGS